MAPEAAAAQEEHGDGHADRNRAVQRESPGERHEAVCVRGQDEEHDTADPSQSERSGRREVAVLRCERTRGERRDQLRERRRNQPRQRIAGHDGRLVRQTARDQLTPEAGEGRGQHGRRNGNGEEGECVGAELRAQASLSLRARQVGHDDHPEGLRTEDEHEVDAVGRHEPVGLPVAAELVREQRAGDGRGQAQGHI